MKTIRDIQSLDGVRVFLRADFNVPILHGAVVDDFRIKAAVPTIEYLRSHGAKIIIASHLEVVEGEKATLEPIVGVLNKSGVEVKFVKDYKNAFQLVESAKPGDCFLLENLRDWDGEKGNDTKFAQSLASLADLYVNDAFSVSHREHASVVGVPKLIPGYIGLQMEKEIENLSKAFNPSHPFLFILGGAKFETKLPLLSKFVDIADTIFVGGALANDLFKAKGFEVGRSKLSKSDFDFSALLNESKIVVPTDVVNEKKETMQAFNVDKDSKIVDAGPETVRALGEHVQAAKFILWNGPLGLYEDGFREPTLELAMMIGKATMRGATTIIGGGDTIAAVASLAMSDKFTFISTGGGAMLDYLAKGTLPGLEVLEN